MTLLTFCREDLHHLIKFTLKNQMRVENEISPEKQEKWKVRREYLCKTFKHPFHYKI